MPNIHNGISYLLKLLELLEGFLQLVLFLIVWSILRFDFLLKNIG